MRNTLIFVLFISAFGGLSAPAFAQICSPVTLNPTTPAAATLTGRGVYIVGDLAYVVSESSGLRIVNVSDPANPTTLNPTTPAVATLTGRGVYVVGDLAYVVSESSGLRIVDVSDPANPTTLNPTTPAVATLTGRGVYVVGDLAYVVSEGFGLRIVDVSVPANPTTLNPATPAVATMTGRGVYVVGDLAYVVSDDYGLRIVDVSVPANPTTLNPVDPPVATLSGTGVYVCGDFAYVVSGYCDAGEIEDIDCNFGLRIVDVSDPANPTTLNPVTPAVATLTGMGVYVEGDLAYVVSEDFGLRAVDVSDCGCATPSFFSLMISVAGSGSVTSTPAGIIDCTPSGGDCHEDYLDGTVVTLTATPDTGSVFVGWSGDCSDGVVIMDSAKTCTATFMQAGAEITKTGPSTVYRGDTFDYTLEYENTGSVELTNVAIADTLPAGVTFVSASDGGTETTGMVTWDLDTLPVGGSSQVTLTVGTSGATPSEMRNENYSITSTETGVVQGSPAVITAFEPASTATVAVSVNSIPERTPLRSGDLVTHTITLTNTINRWRFDLEMPFGPGSLMVFETLIDDGGGTVTMQNENNWEWTGNIGPNGTSTVVFTTRVDDCLYTNFSEAGQGSFSVDNTDRKQVGSAWTPGLPVQRPIAASFSALNLGPAQRIWANSQYQVARPGSSIDFQITLTNQFAADQPVVTIDLPIPAEITPVGDPPFIPPTDPAATYDSSTQTISWSGAINGNQTVVIIFSAELDAGASCQVELPLTGATGTCDDIESILSILAVPKPPDTPYLVGLRPFNGLYTWQPGVDSGFQGMLCLLGEMYFGITQTANGDLWVAGVPTFRFNPYTLDFEIFSEDLIEALGPEGGPSDVAFDLTTGTMVFLERNIGPTPGLAIKRYDPVTRQVTEILDGLPEMDRIVVDPNGMIAGLAETGLIRIDPADPGNYQTFDFTGMFDFVNTGILSLDKDGNYLIQTTDFTPMRESLVKIDRLTGAFTEIVPDLSALLPGIPFSMFRSSAVGTTGEIFLGAQSGNDIAQIELTPTISGQLLRALGTRPPSPSYGGLSDLEYIDYCIVDFHHFARFAELWLATGNALATDFEDLRQFALEWLNYCPHDWQWR